MVIDMLSTGHSLQRKCERDSDLGLCSQCEISDPLRHHAQPENAATCPRPAQAGSGTKRNGQSSSSPSCYGQALFPFRDASVSSPGQHKGSCAGHRFQKLHPLPFGEWKFEFTERSQAPACLSCYFLKRLVLGELDLCGFEPTFPFRVANTPDSPTPGQPAERS